MTWHVIRVRSKDAQKQLVRTSLTNQRAYIFLWLFLITDVKQKLNKERLFYSIVEVGQQDIVIVIRILLVQKYIYVNLLSSSASTSKNANLILNLSLSPPSMTSVQSESEGYALG